MTPIFIQNGKVLVSGNKLRGCCCGARWRIGGSVNAYRCNEQGEKGAPIIPLIPTPDGKLLPGTSGCGIADFPPSYSGNILGPQIIEGVTYYELQNFPRQVIVTPPLDGPWINEFPDGLNSEYPDPCHENDFLLLDFQSLCLPPDKVVIEDNKTQSYTQIPILGQDPSNPTEAVYKFVSIITGENGSIGPNANTREGCRGKNNLPASRSKSKTIHYDVIKIPDPDNAEALICCLSNPVEVVAEELLCFVSCCEGVVFDETTIKRTYWEIPMKVQISCEGGDNWQDLTNPTGLTAPTGPDDPGTGDPGVDDEDGLSSWTIKKCAVCNPSCVILCANENDPDTAITSNIAEGDVPDYLVIEQLCP